jgi:hypothetical protein
MGVIGVIGIGHKRQLMEINRTAGRNQASRLLKKKLAKGIVV